MIHYQADFDVLKNVDDDEDVVVGEEESDHTPEVEKNEVAILKPITFLTSFLPFLSYFKEIFFDICLSVAEKNLNHTSYCMLHCLHMIFQGWYKSSCSSSKKTLTAIEIYHKILQKINIS